VDLPGHGASPFTENFFEEMPDFGPCHLIGYSMGGRLAMQYAGRYPERIASLTVISAHMGLTDEKEKATRLLHDEKWAKKIESIDDFLKQWYDQPIFCGFRPDLTKRRIQDVSGLAKALTFYSLGNQPKMESGQGLFIVGERDEKYRRLHPNAAVVKDAGHMVHLENPQGVAEIIKKRIFR